MKDEMMTLVAIVRDEVRKMLIEASDLEESIGFHADQVAAAVEQRLKAAKIDVTSS